MSTAMNEEALKKNTDCVYFLASPLTCKKGNDCEFRHSESARINPRDCWFWLSGACLNASCPFRHPPLEGIPENDPATAASIGGKPRVPCYYFSQGYCAKGDKCIFMHGLAPPSTTEVCQKLLKPNAIKAMELNDNQVSANKGNGSVTSKPSFDSYETPLPPVSAKSNQALQEADAKFIDIISRMSEGSDSSVPARPRTYQGAGLNDRSKQVSAINDRLCQVETSDNNFLHLQQTQAEDDTLCDAQPPGDESPRQAHSGEDRIQNGTESEELWEESSFDVLVDDGTDQLIYAEDIDYLSPCDIIVDPLRGHIQAGMIGAEGFADYEYEHAGVYDQYYDASAEYELATYDAYEQQLVYDQLNSYDYNNGIQPAIAFKGRQVKEMLPPDRRGVPFDGEARGAAVSSNDLRNHIVKRRRAERNQKHGEDYPRRRHQGNGFHHSRRNQDGHLKLQEGLARNRILPQPGTRSNRQFQGRGEPAGNRQFHGRLVEPMGTKRVYRDMALDQEETSTERVSGKKSRNMDEHFKAKFKKERGWPVAAGAGEVVGVRVHAALHSQKAEVRKDDSSFVGPKSLAQIKAEKMKASGEGSSGQQQGSPGEVSNSLNHVVKRQAPHMSKISPVQGSVNNELASKEPSKIMTPGVSKDSDFEGPKSLSVILKQKHKEDGNGKLKEHRQERSFGLEGDMAVDSMMASGLRTNFSLPAGAKDPKDGGLLQAANPGKSETKSAGAVEHGSRNHRDNGFQQQGATNLTTLLSNNNREEPEDTQSNKLGKEVDPVFDTEDGVDAGDSAMEDVEFEDDDEDDFAKKLGGFFS